MRNDLRDLRYKISMNFPGTFISKFTEHASTFSSHRIFLTSSTVLMRICEIPTWQLSVLFVLKFKHEQMIKQVASDEGKALSLESVMQGEPINLSKRIFLLLALSSSQEKASTVLKGDTIRFKTMSSFVGFIDPFSLLLSFRLPSEKKKTI